MVTNMDVLLGGSLIAVGVAIAGIMLLVR